MKRLFFLTKLYLVAFLTPISPHIISAEVKTKTEIYHLDSGVEIKDKYSNKYQNEYLVGPGDTIKIIVSRGYPELESTVTISGEGNIYLPKIKMVYVKGLSINELNQFLNEEYSKYINFPEVEATVTKYRPIQVMMSGEVNSPGLQTLEGSVEDFDLQSNRSYFPTIYDAIRTSKGITRDANLSKIKVIRVNASSNGGGYITTDIDFNKFLEGNNSHNLRIYDGDNINIGRLENSDQKISQKNAKINFNPSEIDVYVSGRAVGTGKIRVPYSSSLNDAIMIANGAKVLKGKLTFVRFNDDGTHEKRKITYGNRVKPGSYNNPYLKENDLIFIGNNIFNNVAEVIGEISAPFSGVVSTYGLYKVLFD